VSHCSGLAWFVKSGGYDFLEIVQKLDINCVYRFLSCGFCARQFIIFKVLEKGTEIYFWHLLARDFFVYVLQGEAHKIFWPKRSEFVRMAARFGCTIIPVSTVGEDDIINVSHSKVHCRCSMLGKSDGNRYNCKVCEIEGPGAGVWEKHRMKLLEAPNLGYDGVWCCVSFVLFLVETFFYLAKKIGSDTSC